MGAHLDAESWIPLNREGRRANAAMNKRQKNKRGPNFTKPKKRK